MISITLCLLDEKVEGTCSVFDSINKFLFNIDIVPSFQIDFKMEVIVSIIIYRVCEANEKFFVRTDHRDKWYSFSIFTTISCTSIPVKS